MRFCPRCGSRYEHERFSLWYGDALLVEKGRHKGDRAARAALDHLAGGEVRLTVQLGLGKGAATAWGCDLSEGYVRSNAEPL